jgi:NhaP-type Na+/H+ or K+/H+ antiporter
MTVVCTIVLSIIAHGLTANPLIAALVAKRKRIGDQTAADQ